MEDTSLDFRIYSPNTLESLYNHIKDSAKELIGNYIWHKEPFQISLSKDYLSGLINVGESIDDEWFIVYILLQLSKQFEDIAIS